MTKYKFAAPQLLPEVQRMKAAKLKPGTRIIADVRREAKSGADLDVPLMRKAGERYRGGFSDGLVNTLEYQRYVNDGMVFGYFGNRQRTKGRDRLVETIMLGTGLGPKGMVYWLTSTRARHMMDSVDKRTSTVDFARIVRQETRRAMVDVAVWSHPDFNGSLAGTVQLTRAIRLAFAES